MWISYKLYNDVSKIRIVKIELAEINKANPELFIIY